MLYVVILDKFNIYDMKYLKLFEEHRYTDILSKVKNSNIGDIIEESIIYQYIEYLHDDDDFEDGNLPERIEHYPKYKLENVEISNIDLDDFYLDEGKMDEYINLYEDSKYYPPIVLDHEYRIIDGNHRVNSQMNIGKTHIKAFIGIGNNTSFDPFGEMVDDYDDYFNEDE
jgi:hypothetical protein